MKNTNKFLTAAVALVIVLCASVQISAMDSRDLGMAIANYRNATDPKNNMSAEEKNEIIAAFKQLKQNYEITIADGERRITMLKEEFVATNNQEERTRIQNKINLFNYHLTQLKNDYRKILNVF